LTRYIAGGGGRDTIVAETIIELTRCGMRGTQLRAMTVKEFKAE
jgi:hypothetical protein